MSMVQIRDYLTPYFEINSFFAWFAAFWLLAIFLKPIKTSSKTIWLVIGLGFTLRLFWLYFSSHQPHFTWGAPSFIENDWINMHAVDLTRGHWFLDENGSPTGRRPIGYPMCLGLLYKLFGIHAYVAWIFHLVLFCFTAHFIYVIAKRVFLNEIVGILSAFIFSIYPTSIYSIKLITDEHLFLFLWYGGILLILKDLQLRNLKWSWMVYGVIFGFAAMTRTYAIFMPAVIGVAYWMDRRSAKKILITIILTFAVMQIVNLPWAIRNFKVWKVPVVYAVAGHSIYNFTNPMATPKLGHFPAKGEPGYSEDFTRVYQSGNEGELQRVANREVKNWFFRQPVQFSTLAIAKLLYFMHWGKGKGVWPLWYQFMEGNYDRSKQLSKQALSFFEMGSFVSYYIVFHGFFIALILLCKRRFRESVSSSCVVVLTSCFFFWCTLHLIIMPDPKYRFPIEPIMIIFTSYAVFFIRTLFLPRKLHDLIRAI